MGWRTSLPAIEMQLSGNIFRGHMRNFATADLHLPTVLVLVCVFVCVCVRAWCVYIYTHTLVYTAATARTGAGDPLRTWARHVYMSACMHL